MRLDAKALRSRGARTGLAVLLLGIGLASVFHVFFTVSIRESVPVNVARGMDLQRAYPKGAFEETDHRFVVWLTARNARTLLSSPGRLFQAEPCHPAADVLALGEPGISLGVLGIPAWLLGGDPIATYDVVLVAVVVISFVAMLLLVREWTGCFAAGLIAALLYAFHEIKLKDPVHFYAWDGSWTVLALFFATRLFERARWRDALGLAFAIAMQLGGSIYPLLSALFLAPAVMLWLVVHHGLRALRPAPWLFVVACTTAIALPLFWPYLALREAGVLAERGYQVFLDFGWLRPQGPAFPGWTQLVLVAAAFALPRRLAVGARGDPRWALLVVALLLFSAAAGGNTAAQLEAMQRGEPLPPGWPNLYDALAAVLPGLAQVRGPAALYGGVHLVLCVLAGFGVAGLLRAAGARRGAPLAAALVLLALLELLRPPGLGLSPRVDYVAFAMRPPEPELAFFRRIAEVGDRGPLLELPFHPRNLDQSSRAVLLSAYHQRRTQQCFNSFLPPEVRVVKGLADRLPERDALRELAALGFTTILLRPEPESPGRPQRRDWRSELEPLREAGSLQLLAEDGERVAYAITLGREPTPAAAPGE